MFGQTPSGTRKTVAAKDETKMSAGVLHNLGQSNKVKLGIAIFVIGIFVLPVGWKVSTILAGDVTEPGVATLIALDPPAEFEAVVKAMGFVVAERA